MIDYHILFSEKIRQLKKEGGYRPFLEISKPAQHFPKFFYRDASGNHKMAVNWCSNDYLAMSVNEAVISKMSYVAHHSGTGSAGTQLLPGDTIFQRELEDTLAKLHRKERALVFTSAYLANITSLSTLGKVLRDAVFVSDECNHASLVEGIKASGCERKVFHHNDVNDLQQILRSLDPGRPKIVVFESIYSMLGTLSPIREIVTVAKKYNALTYIDEVHSVGLYGQEGAGLAASLGLGQEIDIVTGTLAKGFGVLGGYIAGRQNSIDVVRSFGNGFNLTTSLPPAVCSAANRSVEIVQDASELRTMFHDTVGTLRKILDDQGIAYLPSASHLTIIPVGDAHQSKHISDQLLQEHGVYIQPITYPIVKKGEACLRITVSVKHEKADMHHLANALNEVMNVATF